jgi:hypothetical protein
VGFLPQIQALGKVAVGFGRPFAESFLKVDEGLLENRVADAVDGGGGIVFGGIKGHDGSCAGFDLQSFQARFE